MAVLRNDAELTPRTELTTASRRVSGEAARNGSAGLSESEVSQDDEHDDHDADDVEDVHKCSFPTALTLVASRRSAYWT